MAVRRWHESIDHMSFRRKMSLFLLAAVSLILLTGQFAQYELTKQQTRRQEQEQAMANVAQIETYMEMKMKNVIERLYYIGINQTFYNAVKKVLFDDKGADDSVVMGDISSTLALYKITEPLISSLYLYTPAASYTDNTVLINRDFDFKTSGLYPYMEKKGPIIIGSPCRDEIFITRKNVVPVIYKFTVEGYGGEAALLANLDQNALYEYLKKILLSEDVSVVLYDDEGNRIASSIKKVHQGLFKEELQAEDLKAMALDEEAFHTIRYDGEKYWINNGRLDFASWNLIYVRSEKSVFQKLGSLTAGYVALSFLVLAVIFLVVMAIVKRQTMPLMELSDLMQKAGEEKYEIDFPYRKNDEIGMLAVSFNHMVRYTRELFEQLNQSIEQLKEEKEKVRIEQLLKRRAELKALQAQINPHFLYNTLDSIRWKAEDIEAEDISQMTQALATVFRIGLSRGRELITVEEELEHVGSYLEIQCLRYGTLLKYEIDVDQALMEYYTVKLILQPLVENSIYHGIKEKGEQGLICITGRRELSQMVFTVEDNGMGIPVEQLERLNQDLKRNLSVSKEGYGIYNVNERIRLYFGEAFGLRLESRNGEWTRAVVTLPLIEEWEVESYVPYSDCRR